MQTTDNKDMRLFTMYSSNSRTMSLTMLKREKPRTSTGLSSNATAIGSEGARRTDLNPRVIRSNSFWSSTSCTVDTVKSLFII